MAVPRRGARQPWTEASIRSELDPLLRGRATWPTYQEFIAAGAKGLRDAVGRVHGPEWWAAEMGVQGGDRQQGGVRRWDDATIRSALAQFLGDRDEWPTYREFRAAGQAGLSEAVRQHGGARRWAAEMGLPASRLMRERTGPHWTEQSIARELSGFLADQVEWPRYVDFVAGDRTDLYRAVAKHGGSERWARRMGVRHVRRRGGPSTHWTATRIRERLGALLSAHGRWPTQAEFAAAGEARLLSAMYRHGGVQPWQAEFGLGPNRRGNTPRRAPPRLWTEVRIMSAISPLIRALGRWPTEGEFRAAGLGPALSAIYRHGGSDHWQQLLGVSSQRPPRPAWSDERLTRELALFIGNRRDWPRYSEFAAGHRIDLYKAVARHGGPEMWALRLGLHYPPSRGAAHTYWTPMRIRDRLDPLLCGRRQWPTDAEFAAAGEARLLVAIRRHGGVERWRAEFNVAPSVRDNGSPTGRPRVWTEATITAALSPLVHRVGHWPTGNEFRAAGLSPLLSAVQRYGGSAHWRGRFAVSSRPAPSPEPIDKHS